MSEPPETDEITRDLEAIFADFYGPPIEVDLRGIDAATLALGLSYGFDDWSDVRVAANSRRRVTIAQRLWSEQHPSHEFLSHAVGNDERSLEHLRLLERAHPECDRCERVLARLRAAVPNSIDPELPWLLFQPIGSTRGEAEATGSLQISDRDADKPIRARPMHGDDWRVTIRDPGARQATIRIRWTGGRETVHTESFENDLAVIETEAPSQGAAPESLQIELTEVGDDA